MTLQVFERNEKAIQEASRGNRPDIYTLNKGRTTLRVMGPYSEEGVWFRKILEHFIQVGDDRYIFCCESLDNNECAVCNLGIELVKGDNEITVEFGKKLKPRIRILLNTIIMTDPQGGDPSNGIQVTEVPYTVWKNLEKYDRDVALGYGDITSLESGFNIIVTKEGEGLMTTYDTMAVRERSNIIEELNNKGVDINNFSLFDLGRVKEARDPSEIEVIAEELQKFSQGMQEDAPTPLALPVVDPSAVSVSVEGGAAVPEIPPAPNVSDRS